MQQFLAPESDLLLSFLPFLENFVKLFLDFPYLNPISVHIGAIASYLSNCWKLRGN